MVEEKKTKRTGRKPASSSKKAKKDLTITVNKDAIWKLLSLALGVVIIFVLFRNFYPSGSDQPTTTSTLPATDYGVAKLDFYVMSQCPYGTQVEDAILPVLKKLGASVDFSLNFIANEGAGGAFASLHGQPEVEGDIVQLCAAKYNPDKYMDMVVCQNENARAIPDNWEACAIKFSLDVEKIRVCYTGSEGKSLLSQSIKETSKVGASGSPTIYLNGQQYNGGRDTLSFMRAVCQKLSNHPECQNMPACGSDADCTAQPNKIGKCENPGQSNAKCVYLEPVKVNMILLNDKECSTCNPQQLMSTLMGLFPGLQTRQVDASTEEGQKLIKELGIVFAPAFIFEENIVETNTWKTNSRIPPAFEKVGSYYKLSDSASGASYYVDKEAKKGLLDALKIVEGDNKPQIDFFVMSYCPYGNQCEEAVEPVYQIIKDKAIFNPRYVIYSNYGGGGPQYCLDNESLYCSMHGIQELNQDVRELCVNKHLGTDSFFKFVLRMNEECTSANADTCWEPVAKSLGFDSNVIKDCEKNEALDLLKAELELNKLLGVRGSPTVFIEGESYNGPRTSAGYQAALCQEFDEKPSECDSVVESSVPAAPVTGGCG
ncbi:MAG: hypothetical protein V1921_02840 [Candidatus Altiarchaeota archaeon]